MGTTDTSLKWSTAQVTEQLTKLGVIRGGILLVHTSFRAIRPVENGPRGVIDALLSAIGPQGTLIMPSWSGTADRQFDPEADRCDPTLGIVADVFWRLPGVIRNRHPNAFAAVGPKAEELLRDPFPLPPHIPESPVGRVLECDGQVALIGCGHEANTTLHLAEVIADVPYRIEQSCTVLRDNQVVRITYDENDHCCALFSLADTWMREAGLQAEGFVGNAFTRLAKSRDIVDQAVARLKLDPLVFLHPLNQCSECDEARASLIT